jgi:1-acyl-sn-glycerol-3-phosphate acyltransferase
MLHRIFPIPFLSFFFRTVRAIPIVSSKEDPEGLQKAYEGIAAALAAGELVGLFPEGHITYDGEIAPFRSGIRQIVERTPVPVVPMALSGLWESLFARNPQRLRNIGKLAYKRISLAIGNPVAPSNATPEHLHSLVLQLRGEGK